MNIIKELFSNVLFVLVLALMVALFAGNKVLDKRTRELADANGTISTLQLANSETGVIQPLPEGLWASDLTQAFGKLPLAFNWMGLTAGIVSAHKLGGPKGVGALILRRGTEIAARLRGGGQEMGRRAGTENLIGIAVGRPRELRFRAVRYQPRRRQTLDHLGLHHRGGLAGAGAERQQAEAH